VGLQEQDSGQCRASSELRSSSPFAVNPADLPHGFSPEGTPVFNLNLVSRRAVDDSEILATAFDSCHRDAVSAFVAITTPTMHKAWGRTQ
jgi:hypothetical protein